MEKEKGNGVRKSNICEQIKHNRPQRLWANIGFAPERETEDYEPY